jgi:tetratricopeptide (TPR) repeat protein
MSDDPGHRVCAFCGKPGTKRCGKCRAVWYCSVACQTTSWPQHKTKCGEMAEKQSSLDPDSELGRIVQMRREQEKMQAKAKVATQDQVTELLATLISIPRDPETHFKLAYAYSALYRVAEAVEALGKALTYLLTTHPSAELELEVLRRAPPLLERALVGRGEADWLAEEQVARQLIDFVERVVPLHRGGTPSARPTTAKAATPDLLQSAMSCARRALAGYLARRRQHADCIAQLELADEGMQQELKGARDLKALKMIADEAMALAHETDAGSEQRMAHVARAIRAAREALSATPSSDVKAVVEARMLLARMLYTSVTIRSAPKAAEGVKALETGAAPLAPSGDSSFHVQGDADAAVVREAYELAEVVRKSAMEQGMTIYAEMASMLQGYLPTQPPVAVS